MDLIDILQCPHCGGTIGQREGETAVECDECDTRYPCRDGQFDFRLTGTEEYTLTFEIGHQLSPDEIYVSSLNGATTGLEGERSTDHGIPGIESQLINDAADPGCVLDVGCGEGDQQTICEREGYTWIGVDLESDQATLLCDAHALPFVDQSFDCVLSLKVLEHVANPFIVVNEIQRVLKPDGEFIGSVAFAEPWHGTSVFHHSPIGVITTLSSAGLEVTHLEPGWHALYAHTSMALFPLLPNWISLALVTPIVVFHRLWYRLGRVIIDHEKSTEAFRRLKTTGEFFFVAENTESDIARSRVNRRSTAGQEINV